MPTYSYKDFIADPETSTAHHGIATAEALARPLATARQSGHCPMCGQRLLTRHGVRLRPRHAEIFDCIERSGSRGVTCETLATLLYPDKLTPAAKRLIAVHIHDLNGYLEETDVIVTPSRWQEPYRVARRRS